MIRIEVDPHPTDAQLAPLWQAAWGFAPDPAYAQDVLSRSLVHLGAFDGERLVGFVNVAWDGGVHAFLLDTTVHPDVQRQGIASALVRRGRGNCPCARGAVATRRLRAAPQRLLPRLRIPADRGRTH